MGGKTRLARKIIPRFPAHHTYVEPFCGGCALLCNKPRSAVEIINDRDARLYTLYNVANHHADALLEEMRLMLHSRDQFADYMQQPGITDIQRAARFLYLLKASFGCKANGANFGYGKQEKPGLTRRDIVATVETIRARLDRVTIENLDFADVIARYDSPDTLFYCDPPYIATEGYRIKFAIADHERLAVALAAAAGQAIISLNDHPEARRIYDGWHIETIRTKYYIDKNGTEVNELIISRDPLDDARDGGLFGET